MRRRCHAVRAAGPIYRNPGSRFTAESRSAQARNPSHFGPGPKSRVHQAATAAAVVAAAPRAGAGPTAARAVVGVPGPDATRVAAGRPARQEVAVLAQGRRATLAHLGRRVRPARQEVAVLAQGRRATLAHLGRREVAVLAEGRRDCPARPAHRPAPEDTAGGQREPARAPTPLLIP